MSEGDDSVYEEAKQQVISLHVVHERVENIMELHDPDHPEKLLMTIGENADIVWYIEKNREDGTANEG